MERVSVASGSCRLPRNSANLEKFAPGSAGPPRTHTIYNDKDKNKGKDNGKNKGKDNDSHRHKYRSPLKLVSCVVLVEFLVTFRMDRNWMKVWVWVGQSTLAHVRQINSCVGANDQERWAGVVVFSPGDRCDAIELSSVMGGKLCCGGGRWEEKTHGGRQCTMCSL